MRKLIIIALSVVLLGCVDKNEQFTGYLVCKEYTPSHMSNESVNSIEYSYVPIHPITTHHPPPKPHRVEEKYTWYVANKHRVIERQVTKELFNSKKCGEKVTINCY